MSIKHLPEHNRTQEIYEIIVRYQVEALSGTVLFYFSLELLSHTPDILKVALDDTNLTSLTSLVVVVVTSVVEKRKGVFHLSRSSEITDCFRS